MNQPQNNPVGYAVSFVMWTSHDASFNYTLITPPPQNSSVLSRAAKLSDVHFLLIHGTGDGKKIVLCASNCNNSLIDFSPLFADNVHFQHTAQLVEALTQADVQFRLQVNNYTYM